MTETGGADRRAALHAAFLPVRGRRVATGMTAANLLVFGVGVVLMPTGGDYGYHWWDQLGVALVGLAISYVLWRFARLAAFPDEDGLVVRNLAADRRLAWAEIVQVRFGGGHPWVTLDLADGEVLALMGIQRADGVFGEQEARRLSTLVALHSRTERDD